MQAVVTVSQALFYNLTWKTDNRDKMQAVVTDSLALFYNVEERQQGSNTSCGDCFTGNAVYVIR